MSGTVAAREHTEVVRPATVRGETLIVSLSSLVIIALAALIIGARGRVEATEELAEYQVSAYTGLNATEQGVYNDLLAASLDIDMYHADTLRWPSVLQLQGQYIAPFVKDLSWQQRAGLEWEQDIPDVELQHTVAYYALSSQSEVTGSFLLWMTHKHNMSGPNAAAYAAQRGANGDKPRSDAGMLPTNEPILMDPLYGNTGMPRLSAPSPTLGSPQGASTTMEPEEPLREGAPLKPQVRVWYHPGPTVKAPDLYLDEHLITAGWREVIARTGTDESNRLRGPGS